MLCFELWLMLAAYWDLYDLTQMSSTCKQLRTLLLSEEFLKLYYGKVVSLEKLQEHYRNKPIGMATTIMNVHSTFSTPLKYGVFASRHKNVYELHDHRTREAACFAIVGSRMDDSCVLVSPRDTIGKMHRLGVRQFTVYLFYYDHSYLNFWKLRDVDIQALAVQYAKKIQATGDTYIPVSPYSNTLKYHVSTILPRSKKIQKF